MIRYRDYSIDELFERYDYEDVAFLLIWGHLPKPFEKNTFRFSLVALMAPPPEVLMVVDAFPYRHLALSSMPFSLTKI